jgi:polyhydroxyalkanoate synthesis repressor PhaR
MVIIKRYPNRKLYNTEAKQYITLDGIAELIRRGDEISVVDHASGEDLTALTLTQIILEQEKKQGGLLSSSALTGLIRLGGDRLSALQRSLASSWHQIDEEIRQRIQALVRQGELSDDEGNSLLEKMMRQGARQREEFRMRHSPQARDEAIETYIKDLQIPTQEDVQRLANQLEELSAKLDQVAPQDSPPES